MRVPSGDPSVRAVWTRRTILRLAAISSIGSLLAACGQAPVASPTSAPPKPTEAPKPAEAAKPVPTSKPAPSAADAEWDQVLAAAKREGKIVMIVPQGTALVESLIEGFQQKYPEISVETTTAAGSTIAPKITAEVRSGQSFTDVVITGTTTILQGLIPEDAVQPIEPFLVRQITRDPSKWWDGKLSFADDAGKYALVFGLYVKAPFIYNTGLVKPDDIKSYKGLLDPKWKAKIVSGDPRIAGSTLSLATFWYTTPELGKDFVRQLYTQQEVTILRIDQQAIDGVAQGKYLVGVGSGDVQTMEAISKGLPIQYGPPMPEGNFVTAGNGCVAVVSKLPHPNAAKVYLDWLLSPEGQLAWSKGSGFASLRRDVAKDHVPDFLVPKEGVPYQENHAERYVKLRDELVEFLNTILPS